MSSQPALDQELGARRSRTREGNNNDQERYPDERRRNEKRKSSQAESELLPKNKSARLSTKVLTDLSSTADFERSAGNRIKAKKKTGQGVKKKSRKPSANTIRNRKGLLTNFGALQLADALKKREAEAKKARQILQGGSNERLQTPTARIGKRDTDNVDVEGAANAADKNDHAEHAANAAEGEDANQGADNERLEAPGGEDVDQGADNEERLEAPADEDDRLSNASTKEQPSHSSTDEEEDGKFNLVTQKINRQARKDV